MSALRKWKQYEYKRNQIQDCKSRLAAICILLENYFIDQFGSLLPKRSYFLICFSARGLGSTVKNDR